MSLMPDVTGTGPPTESPPQRAIGRPRRRCTRHLAARFGAFPAGLCTTLAMVHLVFGALRAARIADFGAELAHALGKIRAARHLTFGEGANVGTTAIQLDAACHHLHVFLVQTSGGAMITFNGTRMARLDTVGVVFVRHMFFLAFGFPAMTHRLEIRLVEFGTCRSIPWVPFSARASEPDKFVRV